MQMTRRTALGAIAALAGAGIARAGTSGSVTTVERWGLFEIALDAVVEGNPFAVDLTARFTDGRTVLEVPGFHDGDGVWRIRFSPPATGTWRWTTRSGAAALDGRSGEVLATVPSGDNHGPVGVVDTYHFAHADGTPFRQIGTTCYGWTHQPKATRDLTLQTLTTAPFNKMRMLVFPNAELTTNEPLHPFEKTGPGDRDWDLTRFNPVFFQRLDDSVAALSAMGIQADVILFHPYDEVFGFREMPAEADDRYVRYVVARLSAYRNVWWSMANEYDILETKTEADWDRLFQIVQAQDPHGRLRSIHNWRRLYDHGRPWVTHASIQNGSAVKDDSRALLYRDVWRKPVVFDEVKYEGDIGERWGDLTGPEMVRAFWEGLIAGTYVGHSETFANPEARYWLGEGGVLKGESAPRLAFLKTIMEAGPTPGVEPIDKWWDQHLGGRAGQYYLRYFGEDAPTEWAVRIPRDAITGGEQFRVDVIDTWNMTIEPQPGVFTLAATETKYFFADPDRPEVTLPGRPWMAVRVTRV